MQRMVGCVDSKLRERGCRGTFITDQGWCRTCLHGDRLQRKKIMKTGTAQGLKTTPARRPKCLSQGSQTNLELPGLLRSFGERGAGSALIGLPNGS